MTTELHVIVRYVYGNRLVEPVGDEGAHIKVLIGAKTLSTRHIQALKWLGFTIVVDNQEEV